MQVDGCAMDIRNEEGPAAVPDVAKQAGEARRARWDWVERTVWTERMLEALEKGVKGNVWFSLIDKIRRSTTLKAGWLRVKANGGVGGTDHQSIEDFERNLDANLARLEDELRKGTYRPKDIQRVYIDKPGSRDKRPLGIPAVRDRVVQAAVRLTVEPVFEREFAPGSYGFRPRRGCKDALREVEQLLKSEYIYVVDADIKAYFDNIRHDLLMAEVCKYIKDGRVLELLEGFLKAGILEGMKRWVPEEGTPQGAVISPLLANLFLHPVDIAMAEAGYRMVRYADDFVILCRSRAEAETALAKVRKLIEERELTLHPEKTKVADLSEPGVGFDFLGYHFERTTRWPRKKSLGKVKEAIRRKTRRSNGHSLDAIIKGVNSTLRGWYEYFKHANRRTFPRLDGFVRRRLRSILREREGRHSVGRGYNNIRWPNRFFHDHGLFCLEVARASELLQSSPG